MHYNQKEGRYSSEHTHFKPLQPSDDIWRDRTYLSLVRVMADDLLGTKQLPKSMLTYCN